MGKLYDPREFMFYLKNVDLDGVSSDTVYFLKGGGGRIEAVVSVDTESKITRIKPKALIEEDVEYRIVFSDALCFENGKPFPKSFWIRFRVKDGAAYSLNMIGGEPDYFSPKNQMRFSLVIWLYFSDSVDAPESLAVKTITHSELVRVRSAERIRSAKTRVSYGWSGSIWFLILLFLIVFALYAFAQ